MHLKKTVFILFLIILILSAFQGNFRIFKVTGLYGVDFPLEPVSFNTDNWLEGSFQDYIRDYAKENIGFKPYFVRLANQINFSIFGQWNSTHVVRGKHDYLYETGYVANVQGKGLIHDDSLKDITRGLSVLNSWLQEHNKQLIVILAPNKARYFPEYLPEGENYFAAKSNYSATKDAFVKAELPLIDCIEFFSEKKGIAPYALMPKCGTHWSIYGSCAVADTVMSFLDYRIEEPFRDFEIGKVEVTSKPRFTDNDLNMLLNLMFDIPSDSLAYPELVPTGTERKLNVLGIGDSFYLSFLQNGWVEKCFDPNSLFFFYFISAYRGTEKIDKFSRDFAFKKLLEDADVVLLCATEPNIQRTYGKFSEMCIQNLSNE